MTPTTQPRRKFRPVPVSIGAVLATVGSVVALSGGGLLAAAGDDGTIGSGDEVGLSTSTSALVSSTANIDDTGDVASVLGEPHVGVAADARGVDDVFVGIGRAADVDRYLAGVKIERFTDFDVGPFSFDKQPEGTGTRKAQAPESQDFWVAESSGRQADVDWKVSDGDYRLVVMNADGSPGVDTESHFEAGTQYLSTIALSAMLAGLALLGAGVVLLVRGLNTGTGGDAAFVVPPSAPAGA